MWRLVFIATLYTAVLSSENFDEIQNDILSRINKNLRGVKSDITIENENIVATSNQAQESVKLHFATSDHNDTQKLKFYIETPSQNYTGLEEDGRRINSRPNFRVKVDEPPKRLLKKYPEVKGANANNTLGFPYMAAIIINGRLWCAGAIIDENWVVTAAHCLNYVIHVSPLRSLGTYVKVRVGSVRPHQGGRVIDVVGAVRHPKFEEEPVPHADVALLKLAEKIEFGRYTNLIKIYEGVGEPFAHSFIVVSGWGTTKGADTSFREHTPDLGRARLKVRSQSYCRDAYQLVNGFEFTKDFFCASLRNGTTDLCLFDAGAPAVQHNRLMGIMSFGPERCGHETQPAVFVKAFYFRDFVKSTISSYKTTQELIEAIQDIEPDMHGMHATPEVTPASNEEEDNLL